MYQVTLEIIQATPSTWLEVGHRKSIKTKEALKVGDEWTDFGHIAKVIDVQEIEETPWTDEQEKALQQHQHEEINKSFDRITKNILNN
jgi:hypothetical protein